MNYILFEDRWQNFLPFTYTRFVGDMRVGILKLRQRIGLFVDFELKNIVIRKDLEALYRQRHPDWQVNRFPAGEYTFINSCLKINDSLTTEIEKLQIGERLISAPTIQAGGGKGGDILAFKIKLDKEIDCTAEQLCQLYNTLTPIETKEKAPLWNYTWEFIHQNGKMIQSDYELVFYEEDNYIEIDPGVVAINPYDIWIGENATLQHGVILDASKGAIVIDEGAVLMHNAVIVGPAYIGKNTQIKIGAKIYPNTSIGAHCKVGGEVEDTIIQAYTNKQHEGFLGHSYVGEWVNIGADTNNSDLKNTYKPVKVWFYPERTKVSTDDLFIGAFIGDHSKIGINCSINTGTVIGFGTNIYGSDLVSDFIPSFSWGEAKHLITYHFDKFLETTANVKLRRQEALISEEIEVIKKLYENISKYEDKI